jgi:chromosome segregation ATPase
MTLDALPQQFEAFVERARAALSQETTAAKNIVASANAETGLAQAALSDVQSKIKSARDQLDEIYSELGKASTLAGVTREITAANKKLEKLKAETAEATTALEALQKQRTEAEAKLVALGNEAQRQLGIRLEAEEPFVPKPHEPIDWTARMSMPPSALRAMVEAVPDRLIKDIVQDNRAPTGPTTERKP